MSFGKFFKDSLLPVAVWTCGVLLSCFVLAVAGASTSIVVVAVGVSFIFGMLGVVIEYARRRRFLRQLERAAEELESPTWVQEMVQCPTYAEGELEYEVLRRVGKAACDEVAEGRRQTDDYRDYIESWVHEAKLPLAAAHLILENLDGSEDDLSRVDDLGRELARVERYIDQALYYARSEVVERDYLIRRWDLKTLVTGAIKANARELIAAHVPRCARTSTSRSLPTRSGSSLFWASLFRTVLNMRARTARRSCFRARCWTRAWRANASSSLSRTTAAA